MHCSKPYKIYMHKYVCLCAFLLLRIPGMKVFAFSSVLLLICSTIGAQFLEIAEDIGIFQDIRKNCEDDTFEF